MGLKYREITWYRHETLQLVKNVNHSLDFLNWNIASSVIKHWDLSMLMGGFKKKKPWKWLMKHHNFQPTSNAGISVA